MYRNKKNIIRINNEFEVIFIYLIISRNQRLITLIKYINTKTRIVATINFPLNINAFKKGS